MVLEKGAAAGDPSRRGARPRHHGQGIGRSLYVALLAVLARQGFVAVFGGITLPNAASVRLHEALGFQAVGAFPRVGFKHGAWHDVGFWRRQLLVETLEPAEPVEFSRLNPSEIASILELAVSGRAQPM
jgi:phosphinothricin acetyltransferase